MIQKRQGVEIIVYRKDTLCKGLYTERTECVKDCTQKGQVMERISERTGSGKD